MNETAVAIYPVLNRVSQGIHDPNFDSRLATWQRGTLELGNDGTHFGFVASGKSQIECSSGKFELQTGMYFSIPGEARLVGDGTGFVASRVGFNGFFHLGGPTETQGRLKYIDGCSDSLLIPPVVVGDPCLNLLYLPPGTTQTEHTHPSCRLGMIISGSGVCRTPEQDIPLSAGLVFNIAPGALHSFHTQADALRVAAWHPDSDFGPTNEDHPMINRTIVNGVSARFLTTTGS